MKNHPKARQNDLVVQKLFDELVIYDLECNQIHSLNPTAAQVWQACDGRTSPAELASRLQTDLAPAPAKELVWLALDRLEQARLLEQKVTRPSGLKISRRRALRALGLSALLLPVVASIPAPTAAQSLTCAGAGRTYSGLSSTGSCSAGDGDAVCDSQCGTDGFGGGYALGCLDDGLNTITKVDCCCTA